MQRNIGFYALCKEGKVTFSRKKSYSNGDWTNAVLCCSHNFIYFPITKVGSTAIKNFIFFEDYGLKNVTSHKNRIVPIQYHFARYNKEQLQEERKSKISFVVIRDPIERVVSCYAHRFVELFEFGNNGAMDFDDFLDIVERDLQKPIMQQNKHIRPQYSFFSSEDVDYIVPLKELSVFFKEKFDVSLPKENAAKRNMPEVSDQQKERIKKMYEEDMKIQTNY